ncbi:MAG TPA: hypothetical protein VMT44_03645 [Methanoregula sp.]|nr:hypothetical protein [Methanoregula sp.]
MLEVYHNATNQQRFVGMTAAANLTNAGIPLIFIGGVPLEGEDAIRDHFEEQVISEEKRLCGTTPGTVAPDSLQGNCTPAQALTPGMIILPALADSLNPCALSVLIFLLIAIAAAGDRRRILLTGCIYSIAVFLFHFMVGIGIFSFLSLSGFARTFSILGALVALLMGGITLAEAVAGRESFLLSVPSSGKGILAGYLRRASLPAAFVLGILSGLLGFSCTGGIYISILGLMGRSIGLEAGLPWLLLYNLIFILPLVLVTLGVGFGVSPGRAEAWRTGHRRILRLLIGLVMAVLGAVILLGWFG